MSITGFCNEGKKIKRILVSGAFDIIHSGHVRFFEDAKSLGDHLTVVVPTDEIIIKYKHRVPAITLQDRICVIKSFKMVDSVEVGDDELPLNFKNVIEKLKPDILASTEDDRFSQEKIALCQKLKIEYVQLPKKTLTGTSATSARISVKTPIWVPLRFDIAGGWLDVPKFSNPNGYIVNCTFSPLVSLDKWIYQKNSGLGGSAAYALLMGKDPVESELSLGVGWQDPAIIKETGLCAWRSGLRPNLIIKSNPEWLRGRLYLLWTGKQHSTPDVVDYKRNYQLITEAGILAYLAIVSNSFEYICDAVKLSYEAQTQEGMQELPNLGERAKKYLGGGWGGYALYLNPKNTENLIQIQPYMRQIGE